MQQDVRSNEKKLSTLSRLDMILLETIVILKIYHKIEYTTIVVAAEPLQTELVNHIRLCLSIEQ